MIGMVPLVISLINPESYESRERRMRAQCLSNLRQIGQACLLYANDHQGRFPVSFEQLVKSGRLSVQRFVCPSANDEPATGATPDDILAKFAKPGHCSYVYVGGGLRVGSPRDAVVAHDRLVNHEREGINVLFADGRVEWMSRDLSSSFLAELKAGFNPPRPVDQRPATQPATQ